MRSLLTACITAIFISFSMPLYADSSKPMTFQQFLTSVKQEAIKLGISKQTANTYLNNIKLPIPVHKTIVVERQQHQAQKILTFKEYRHRLIPPSKIKRAREEYRKHRALLKKIEKKYHVPGQYIIALWAIESDFGDYVGNFPIVRSLAILAYHHHRSPFYRRQLIDMLMILNSKKTPPKMLPYILKGAWDGGMGQTQFEPSAYLAYAVDFDGDGFKNIWTNLPDAFASIANYLRVHGWHGKQVWGIPVTIPNNFPDKLANRYIKKSIQDWNTLGVRQIDDKPLKIIPGKHFILMPDGKGGPAYLTYHNFNVLLQWNDTTYEGMTVGILADKIVKP